jgi:uncharacterized SAM-binding protein YcdF (DUF218 family)
MQRGIMTILIALLLWFTGFGYYIYLVKSYKIDNSIITEAIAVSTGGRQRIETAIALLKVGYAPILFIAGIDSPSQLKNLLAEYNVKPSQVIYAQNKFIQKDDAREIADFVIANNLHSIRLVTSSYDMPIAIKEVEMHIPVTHNIHIVPHPVISEYNEYKMLLVAYNKYLGIFIKDFF